VKIDSSLKAVAPAKAKAAKGGGSRILSASARGDSIRDEVELTDGSARLRELEAHLAELDITDPQKIESIRQAIADGTFKVDQEAVADALVQEALDQLRHMLKR
jgi:negative regulator of flagellin synthesis FlgM